MIDPDQSAPPEQPAASSQIAAVTQVAVDLSLDVTGMACPMPLLKAKQALNRLPAGALLQVIATDPGSERDFAVFARQSGHALLQSRREQDQYVFVLRKAG